MTPIVHTIEVGEIIAARTWKVSHTQHPYITIDGAIYSTRNLIEEWGDTIETLLTLTSNQDSPWPIGERLEATCIKGPGESEYRDCKSICGAPCTIRLDAFRSSFYAACPCGIYAYNLVGVMGRVDVFTRNGSANYARGLVALSGRVIEHALGYRAEFARPLALATYESSHAAYQVISSLIKNYNLNSLPSFTELIRALAIDEHRRGDELLCP